MKPVAICRYAPHEGPGHLAAYLDAHEVPWHIVKIDEGEPLPHVNGICGLAMMGGPMSVNDDLPWIPGMLVLIRECIAADVPTLGHCLGGQLMAKALGGVVAPNAVREIGWGRIDIASRQAAEWGTPESFTTFQWHGETFSIPPGAVRIWSGPYCTNQAFVYGAHHLAMQCHVEMTLEMIERWCDTGEEEIAAHNGRSPAVQTRARMLDDAGARLPALNRIADRVYDRWACGLRC
jgi:GMP synthase-like glutamine amidotransferase